MNSNVNIIHDFLPFGKPDDGSSLFKAAEAWNRMTNASWAALYHLAREIDRLKEPTYGPMLKEEDEES